MDNSLNDMDAIYQYTRQSLIDDGLLVEVSTDIAQQAGFRVPVGILTEVWQDCIEWTDEDSERQQVFQDEIGRLWDLLNVLRVRAKACGGDTVFFTISRIPRDGKSKRPENVKLKSVIGPGDNREPVITVMFPNQD